MMMMVMSLLLMAWLIACRTAGLDHPLHMLLQAISYFLTNLGNELILNMLKEGGRI
jgi:hypothetical protein